MQRKTSLTTRISFRPHHLFFLFLLLLVALLTLQPSLKTTAAGTTAAFQDPSLIGGIRVVVGDEVLDTSVKARLEQMKVALTA